MDNVASEVSKKVKSAIKAKLTELGAYVDDELPDYIMVLVANRKTKDQMDDDLSLFLGHNTERFTSWLHNVLQKLNAAAILQNKIDDEVKEELPPPPPPPPPTPPPPPQVVVPPPEEKKEAKEPKKKKDKTSKKKDRKEKKKKKDKKQKKSKSHNRKEKEKAKSGTSPLKDIKIHVVNERAIANNAKDASHSTAEQDGESSSEERTMHRRLKRKMLSAQILNLEVKENNQEEEEDLPEDVVDLRPDADDLALGLEDEAIPTKKIKVEDDSAKRRKVEDLPSRIVKVEDPPSKKLRGDTNHHADSSSECDDDSPLTKSSPFSKIIIPSRESKKLSTDEARESKLSVHDRLGPALPRRVVNAPSKAERESIPGRIASNAINSVIKSVVVVSQNSDASEGRTKRKLEARVRPLVSTRLKTEASGDEDDEGDEENELPSTTTRIVSAVGAILKRPHSDNELSDEEPQAKRMTGLASKVEVAPRPRRVGVQANTALILKAVADAHKSVSKLVKKPHDEREDESAPKKKEIFTKSYQERQKHRLNFPPSDTKSVKKIAITVPNAVKKEQIQVMESEEKSLPEEPEKERGSSNSELEEEVVYDTHEIVEEMLPRPKSLQHDMKEDPKYNSKEVKPSLAPLRMDEITQGHPRFIVTLDGFESEQSHLKTRLGERSFRTPSIDEEEYIEEVEEWEEVEEEVENVSNQDISRPTPVQPSAIPPKDKLKTAAQPAAAKISERCVFWPACKEGETCPYIHPTKVCKMFPSCSFADKCIYIHPKCKFDALCAKINCPFTHSSVKRLQPVPVPAKPAAIGLSLSKIKCKYYPKCTDMNCPFMHPKQMCWYGASCYVVGCPYIHPTTVHATTGTNKMSKLKWIAPPKSATIASTTATKAEPISTAPITESVVTTSTTATASATTVS